MQLKKVPIILASEVHYKFLNDIIYFEADGPTCEAYLVNEEKPLHSCKSFGYYNDWVKNEAFFIINRSVTINKMHVIKFNKKTLILTMSNGERLKVARNRKNNLENFLNNS